jgi:uncharacterized protein (DUF4213/DUF364 family)
MLISRVLDAAKPYLANRIIKDAVIGLSLIAVELDNGNLGVSYMLREKLPAGCSVFPYAQEMLGRPAYEIAEWVLSGREDAQRGIGMAVVTAASRSLNLHDVDDSTAPFGIKILPTDKVGMIGYIPPLVEQFRKGFADVLIFDEGQSLRGGYSSEIHAMEDQPRLLPGCDVVILSGTTMINNTIDEVLKLCQNAREIIMIGSSTPMFSEAFKGTKVTVLAGSWWDSNYKEEIFKSISLACGISYLSRYMIKKAVHV